MSISSSRFELALEQLKPSDWERFESLCSAFLSTEFSGLRTMASPGGDRGRDAELYNFSDEPNVLFQYSVTENWKPKIQKTLERLRVEFPSTTHITFLSNQKIGASADDVKLTARKAGFTLDVRDRNWFIERMHADGARQAAAEELARVLVDPLLEAKGVIRTHSGLQSDDLKIALTFLELQARDEDSSKGLTKSSFDSLVRAALSGTTSANLVNRTDIHSRVQRFLPQHSPSQLAPFVDAALTRMQRNAIKHHRQQDAFHISHQEEETIKNRLSGLKLLERRFYEDIADISEIILGKESSYLDQIKIKSKDVIELYFYQLGETFAQAVSKDIPPPIQEDLIRKICETNAPHGKISNDLSWVNFLYSLTNSILQNAAPKTVEYLRLLSSAYTLFAFLSATPDVQKVTKKMFDHGSLWFDTTVLLPLFAERAYPEDLRPFTDLMIQLKRLGLEMNVTSGVIEEIERHLNLCKTYINTSSKWEGRVPYVYQRYALAGKSKSSFSDWLENFMGDYMPLEDIGDFLSEKVGITVAESPGSEKIPEDVIAEIEDYWRGVQDNRRKTRDQFSISANRLAAHDSENYLAVLSQRHLESGKSILGYTSWLVTLDSAAWRLINKVTEPTRNFIRHSPVISLDFLIKYLSFGPRRDQLMPSDKGHARIFSAEIFESISPELITAAEDVRKTYGSMDERLIQRRIRDELNKQKVKAGIMQIAGLEGMDAALQSTY